MVLSARSQDLGVANLDDFAKTLTDYGYNGVQLVPHKTFSDVACFPTHRQAQSISAQLQNFNVQVVLVGAYFNPVHPNKEKVKFGKANFLEYIKLARDLGGDTVGSETGSYNGDKWTYNPLNRTPEALKCVVDTFVELCKSAAQYGVNVGIEGAAGHCLYNLETLKKGYQRIVNRLEKQNLFIIFDLFNMLDSDNAKYHMTIAQCALELFEGKICCFHIKDCTFKNGEVRQVRPGAGELNLKAYLKMIKEYDKDAKLVLEGVTGSDIVPALDFVKNAIQ
ncbi:MAG: sugar phosphate isomerase/epimerase [Clostridiales bacterium]|jgi:sugar phosphate isomerase/epimerase|nr:sugar phosphate isomerase/epimerase [Clostridiales bacterium]